MPSDTLTEIITDDERRVTVTAIRPEHIRRFKRLARGLQVLIAEVNTYNKHANLYQECDTLHLMVGPSHVGRNARPIHEHVVESVYIPGSDGGAW